MTEGRSATTTWDKLDHPMDLEREENFNNIY
jgi:hypothetical protein